MVPNKSLDEQLVIAALLHDIHMSHGLVFNSRALKLTLQKVNNRIRAEGLGFLTKTLPRLGKALDKALSLSTPLSGSKLNLAVLPNTELPRFLGEFFSRVLYPDGTVLPNPCINSIRVLRDVLYLFYKYELPYTDEQEQVVITSFKKTEDEILARSSYFRALHESLVRSYNTRRDRLFKTITPVTIAREARLLLERVFRGLDITDIIPRHGPGAVATKQRLSDKYRWTNISSKLTDIFPIDKYFCSSPGHVCDTWKSFKDIQDVDLPARVVLVPKDSRGPRLISCEPVDFQWIQQGIMSKIVSHVERHCLTKDSVFFTNQEPNRNVALLSSRDGAYSTLDLNEASDRVSLDLVRLLFPEHITTVLECCRSSSTVLPSGEVQTLNKFAPMGSALCFPILALTVWALLSAAPPNADVPSHIYVYGDDVIVPTAYAANAIERLELFGLKVNRDKSCTNGFFRESCGMDAYKGVPVTPVRLRTVWSSTPSPEVYTSWIAYANSMFDRKYFSCYDLIVGMLHRVYGEVPSEDMHLACPSLREVPEYMLPKRRKLNKGLQKVQYKVWDTKAPVVIHEMEGWSMLLRFFAEAGNNAYPTSSDGRFMGDLVVSPFSVRQYTKRRSSMLVRRWR